MTGAVLLIVAALAQGAPVRTLPAGAPATEPKGTAVVKGRITAADTGRPLRRAQVTLATSDHRRSTSTNARGEYELRDVPAGRYRLDVRRSGYLPMAYGQRRGGEPPGYLEIADGAALEKLDVALPKAGVISGRLADEVGEPIPGVQVWAMRTEFFRGRRRQVPAGEGQTDDAGNFRLVNLSPGQYVVLATARGAWTGRDRHTYAYAPTFFPGTSRPTDASAIDVNVGRETPNVEFALVAERAATVSGMAMASDGTPLAGGRVSLWQEMLGPSSAWSRQIAETTAGADGSWRMTDVPPGEYRLEAGGPDRGRGIERGAITLVVQGPEVSGITLTASPPGLVKGQVVTEDGRRLPRSFGRLRVIAEPLTEGGASVAQLQADADGTVDDAGTFRRGSVSGPAALRVFGLPPGWAVRSMEGPDGDITEVPLDVAGGRTVEVRIMLTDRFPAVAGRVVDERGNPLEALALLVPADERRWFDSHAVRSTRSDGSGAFHMTSVRPGEYFAVALESVLSWQVHDPEFLAGLRDRGTRVTVREGQPAQLDLRVMR